MTARFASVNVPDGLKGSYRSSRFDIIYQPNKEALEYAPWAANLVDGGRGTARRTTCSHQCRYCYNHLYKESMLPGPVLKPRVFERFETDLRVIKKYLLPGERVHLTFVGDLYDPALPEGTARKCLEPARKHGIPFQVLTKGGSIAFLDFDLYSQADWFGCTLTFDNEVDSLKWEPNAALPEDRIDALRIAKKLGIATWVSLEPVIDPAQSLHLIELTSDYVDFYGVGKLNHYPEIERTIDWPKFRSDAEALLTGKEYKIKKALRDASGEVTR